MRAKCLLVTAIGMLLGFSNDCGAQGALAKVSGSVRDPQGLVVPSATVTVRSADTGSRRLLHTDLAGRFRAEGLPSGAYLLEASSDGLVSRRPVRIALTVGGSLEVVIRMDIASAEQSTTVRARGGTVEGNSTELAQDETEASLGTFLPGLTITYLPSRDRDFTRFASQSATAVEDPLGTGVAFAGQRTAATASQVDGTSYNDPLLGGERNREHHGVYLPLGVIREAQIVESGVNASIGNTGAGLINIATKSGANRARGDLYYSIRPSSWAAADAFGNAMRSSLHSFGFAEAGAIRKDTAFYSAGIQQDFVTDPYFVRFAPQSSGIVIPAPLLAEEREVGERKVDSAGFGRTDWKISTKNTLTLSLALNRIRSSTTGDGSSRSIQARSLAFDFGGQSKTARAALATLLGGSVFNQLALAYSNDHGTETPRSLAPELHINGFGSLGGNASGLHQYTSQQWQVIEDLVLARGGYSLAMGIRQATSPAYEYREVNTNGRFDYASLEDFAANRPRRFQQTIVTSAVRPDYSGSVKELAAYLNLKIQVVPRLSVTAGLRWAAQWNPQPSSGSSLVVMNGGNPSVPAIDARIPNDLRQWQPRLGVALAPGNRTTVRASIGLYTAPTPATFFHRVFTGGGSYTATLDSLFDPALLGLAGGYTPNPRAFAAVPASATMKRSQIFGIDEKFRNPASLQVAVSVERRWTAKVESTIGYQRASTYRLERQNDQNLAPPTAILNGNPVFPTRRPDVSAGRVLIEQSGAHSTYDAGLVAVKLPLSARSTVLAHYTLSHAVDDYSNSSPLGPVTTLNPFDLRREKANSSLDTRHTVNLNAVLNLPAGFKLNPLFVARTGLPYTPVVGFDTQMDMNDFNDRALINGLAAARNSRRQPAFSSLDLRIVKDFTLKGEGHHLDLFLDVFNILGSPNRRFDSMSVSMFGEPAHPVYAAGQPLFAPSSTQTGGPRSIQFTARLVGF